MRTHAKNMIIFSLLGLLAMTTWSLQEWLAAWLGHFHAADKRAVLAFCAVYCAASLLCLPIMPFILAAGALFGFYWGLVLNLCCAMLSAVLAFVISRRLGLAWLPQVMQQRLAQWLVRLEGHGWQTLACCRLIPLLPASLINYGYGMTKIKFSVFTIISLLFFIPLKILETYCGYMSVSMLTGGKRMLQYLLSHF